MRDYRISAFSDEYDSDLEEQCRALVSFGIGCMEMRGVNGKNVSALSREEVLDAKRVLDAHGIEVTAIGSPLGKIPLDGDLEAHTETAKRIFETASVLGAKNIRIFSFYIPKGKSRDDCRERVIAELERLLELANDYGLTLCHENEALIYGESPACCLELAERLCGRLRLVFDMGNFVLDGYDPMEAYELLKHHIEYFHIKDALYAGAIVPAGRGEARIKEILALHQSKASSPTFITLEPHLQTFSGLNALVGKTFDNPYKYKDQQSAFADAWTQLRNLL